MEDKRSEKRFEKEKLPECLQTIVLKTGLFKKKTAETINASYNGMNFLVYDITKRDIDFGQSVKMFVVDHDFSLKARVIYIHESSGSALKVGIQFTDNKSIHLYHDLLDGK